MKYILLTLLLITLSISHEHETQSLDYLTYSDFLQLLNLERPSRKEALELARGFIKGIAIFNNIPSSEQCVEGNEAIIDDLTDIIEILKDKSDYVKLVEQLVTKLVGIFFKLDGVVESCRDLAKQVKDVIHGVERHVANPKYLVQLPIHLYKERKAIKNKAHDAKSKYENKQFGPAGEGFGDLVHFIFLWNL
jgi:hypothetical protein